MSEITRKETIEQLKLLKNLEDSLGEISGNKNTKVSQALEFAINSLEVDEAYQLEYENFCELNSKTTRKPLETPTITLDGLKEIREEITRFTSRYSLAKERGGTGQVEWSDYLIKESDVLAILDKKISELEGK